MKKINKYILAIMMTFAFILTATPYQVYAATGSIEIPIISHSVSAGYNYSQGKTSGRFSLAGAKYVSFSFYSFASKAQATLYGVRANGTVNTLFTYDCPTTNGSTSATYTFTDADLETYEEFYVYAFGHCNYGDAEARPAASAQISATLYKSASPVITSNLPTEKQAFHLRKACLERDYLSVCEFAISSSKTESSSSSSRTGSP